MNLQLIHFIAGLDTTIVSKMKLKVLSHLNQWYVKHLLHTSNAVRLFADICSKWFFHPVSFQLCPVVV